MRRLETAASIPTPPSRLTYSIRLNRETVVDGPERLGHQAAEDVDLVPPGECQHGVALVDLRDRGWRVGGVVAQHQSAGVFGGESPAAVGVLVDDHHFESRLEHVPGGELGQPGRAQDDHPPDDVMAHPEQLRRARSTSSA
jgi:hypothetical protein